MNRYFIPILILSLIACCIETDVSVPSFPDIQSYFSVSEGTVQLTIAYNFLGFCIASFLYGPLSESFGRRRLMIIGNLFLCVGAIGCVLARDINSLLIARFIQGIGSSTSAVLVFAMIADVYSGSKSAKLIGIMNSALTIVMSAAPILGGFLNSYFGWRGNYAVIAGISIISWVSLVFFLPETKKQFDNFSGKKILGDYFKLFTSIKFMSASLVPSILCGGYLAFITSSSFLYTQTFGITINEYVFHQVAVIGSFSLISLYSGNILQKYGTKESVTIATLVCCIGASAMVLVSIFMPLSYYLFTSTITIFMCGMAIIYPAIFAYSMEIFPDIKGASSSAIMGSRALIISAVVFAGSKLYDGRPVTIASLVLICFTIALPIILTIIRSNSLSSRNKMKTSTKNAVESQQMIER